MRPCQQGRRHASNVLRFLMGTRRARSNTPHATASRCLRQLAQGHSSNLTESASKQWFDRCNNLTPSSHGVRRRRATASVVLHSTGATLRASAPAMRLSCVAHTVPPPVRDCAAAPSKGSAVIRATALCVQHGHAMRQTRLPTPSALRPGHRTRMELELRLPCST